MEAFDWELYGLEEQKFASDFDHEYEKAWEVPSDVEFLGAPGYSFPATEHTTKALCDFGKNLLTVCREILESCGGMEISGVIRGELVPRVVDAISGRQEKIRQRLTSLTLCGPEELQMAVRYMDQKTDGFKEELKRELEILAIKFAKQAPFTHSDDYRSVKIRGARYALTSRQAQMIEILHKAYSNGTLDVSIARVLEELGSNNSRWQDTFKGRAKAKQALVKSGASKGTLRLNL